MAAGYFVEGTKIKLEIDVIPPYLAFWGEIKGEEEDLLVVGIEGNYAQKEERKVHCTIPVETKAVVFDTMIADAKGGKLYLRKPFAGKIEVIQRRKYIRVPTELPVVCYLIGINDRKVESHKYFPGTIKDLSGGGVLLNTSMSLPVGTVVVFELDLDQNTLLLTAKLLREPVNVEGGGYDYGCEFIGLSESDRQKISAYCTKMQLIKRK